MKKFIFSLFNPSGNTTLFLHEADNGDRARLCALAMKVIPSEQAGFADIACKKVVMAGGEFCVNAARAFGALLYSRLSANFSTPGTESYEIEISGWERPVELVVGGQPPLFTVKARLNTANCFLERLAEGMTLVRLPGINHLLIESPAFPNRTEVASLARELELRHMPPQLASVVVWHRKTPAGHEIFPFVRVPAAGTAMLENSCGSGSLALALAENRQNAELKILQPGGDCLAVLIAAGYAEISGPVALMAQGEVWL